jgi:hypothetical protein
MGSLWPADDPEKFARMALRATEGEWSSEPPPPA